MWPKTKLWEKSNWDQNLNCDKTQIVTQVNLLKNPLVIQLNTWQNLNCWRSNYDKTCRCDNPNCGRKNSNCDKTESVTIQIPTKLYCDKNQVLTKLKWTQNFNWDNNSNIYKNWTCDKLKWWHNLSCDKILIVTHLKLINLNYENWNCDNSNCDKTEIVKQLKLWQNSNQDQTQIVTKLKLWLHSNWDTTQIGTKPKMGTQPKLW